jgi:hypothetical protein
LYNQHRVCVRAVVNGERRVGRNENESDISDILIWLLKLTDYDIDDVCVAGMLVLEMYCSLFHVGPQKFGSEAKETNVFFASMSTDVFLRNHVIPFITRASEVGVDLFLVSPASWYHSGEWHDILWYLRSC